MEANNYVPEIYIGENGNWFINGSDTGQPSRGPQGIQGPKGDIDVINDQTPTYIVASELTDLSSGEKVFLAFGKIAKAVSTLISHISLKATDAVAGHVKLSRTTSVTETGAYALDAVEKNVGISGTLANQIAQQDMRLEWKLVGGTTTILEKILLPINYREIIVEISVSGLILNSIHLSHAQLKEYERAFTTSYYSGDYYAGNFKATSTYVYPTVFAFSGSDANGSISVYYR